MIVPKRTPRWSGASEKGLHEIAWQNARKEEEYEDLGVLTLMVKGRDPPAETSWARRSGPA